MHALVRQVYILANIYFKETILLNPIATQGSIICLLVFLIIQTILLKNSASVHRRRKVKKLGGLRVQHAEAGIVLMLWALPPRNFNIAFSLQKVVSIVTQDHSY